MVNLLGPAWVGSVFVLLFFVAVCWVFDGLPFAAPHALPPLGPPLATDVTVAAR